LWRDKVEREEKEYAEEEEQGREEAMRWKSRGQRRALALILLHIFILFLIFVKGPSSPPNNHFLFVSLILKGNIVA
jgi:hypothetical protein